jgi:hypothetical protein
MPARFSISTISAGIRRDVSISDARAVMAGRNSWIALSKDSAAGEGDMPEEACPVFGERKRLLMIVSSSWIFVGDLSPKRHGSGKDP